MQASKWHSFRHNFKNDAMTLPCLMNVQNGKRKKNRRGGDDGEDRYSRAGEAEATTEAAF